MAPTWAVRHQAMARQICDGFHPALAGSSSGSRSSRWSSRVRARPAPARRPSEPMDLETRKGLQQPNPPVRGSKAACACWPTACSSAAWAGCDAGERLRLGGADRRPPAVAARRAAAQSDLARPRRAGRAPAGKLRPCCGRGGANAAEPVATLLAELRPDGRGPPNTLWARFAGPAGGLSRPRRGADPDDPRLHAACERLLETAAGEAGSPLARARRCRPC